MLKSMLESEAEVPNSISIPEVASRMQGLTCTRRAALRLFATVAGGMVVAACAPTSPQSAPAPVATTAGATPPNVAQPTQVATQAAPAAAAQSATSAPAATQATASPATAAQVATPQAAVASGAAPKPGGTL